MEDNLSLASYYNENARKEKVNKKQYSKTFKSYCHNFFSNYREIALAKQVMCCYIINFVIFLTIIINFKAITLKEVISNEIYDEYKNTVINQSIMDIKEFKLAIDQYNLEKIILLETEKAEAIQFLLKEHFARGIHLKPEELLFTYNINSLENLKFPKYLTKNYELVDFDLYLYPYKNMKEYILDKDIYDNIELNKQYNRMILPVIYTYIPIIFQYIEEFNFDVADITTTSSDNICSNSVYLYFKFPVFKSYNNVKPSNISPYNINIDAINCSIINSKLLFKYTDDYFSRKNEHKLANVNWYYKELQDINDNFKQSLPVMSYHKFFKISYYNNLHDEFNYVSSINNYKFAYPNQIIDDNNNSSERYYSVYTNYYLSDKYYQKAIIPYSYDKSNTIVFMNYLHLLESKSFINNNYLNDFKIDSNPLQLFYIPKILIELVNKSLIPKEIINNLDNKYKKYQNSLITIELIDNLNDNFHISYYFNSDINILRIINFFNNYLIVSKLYKEGKKDIANKYIGGPCKYKNISNYYNLIKKFTQCEKHICDIFDCNRIEFDNTFREKYYKNDINKENIPLCDCLPLFCFDEFSDLNNVPDFVSDVYNSVYNNNNINTSGVYSSYYDFNLKYSILNIDKCFKEFNSLYSTKNLVHIYNKSFSYNENFVNYIYLLDLEGTKNTENSINEDIYNSAMICIQIYLICGIICFIIIGYIVYKYSTNISKDISSVKNISKHVVTQDYRNKLMFNTLNKDNIINTQENDENLKNIYSTESSNDSQLSDNCDKSNNSNGSILSKLKDNNIESFVNEYFSNLSNNKLMISNKSEYHYFQLLSKIIYLKNSERSINELHDIICLLYDNLSDFKLEFDINKNFHADNIFVKKYISMLEKNSYYKFLFVDSLVLGVKDKNESSMYDDSVDKKRDSNNYTSMNLKVVENNLQLNNNTENNIKSTNTDNDSSSISIEDNNKSAIKTNEDNLKIISIDKKNVKDDLTISIIYEVLSTEYIDFNSYSKNFFYREMFQEKLIDFSNYIKNKLSNDQGTNMDMTNQSKIESSMNYYYILIDFKWRSIIDNIAKNTKDN